jgi:hypothetical protein
MGKWGSKGQRIESKESQIRTEASKTLAIWAGRYADNHLS